MATDNLKKDYNERIVPLLMKQFGYSSVMQVPSLTKIVVNQGLGAATGDKKLIEIAQGELALITGQKPVVTYSKRIFLILSSVRVCLSV